MSPRADHYDRVTEVWRLLSARKPVRPENVPLPGTTAGPLR